MAQNTFNPDKWIKIKSFMCENIGLSSQFNSSPWMWSTLGFSAHFGKASTFFRKQALSVTVAIVPFVSTNPVWNHQRAASATVLHRLSLSLLLQSSHLRPYVGRVLFKTSRYKNLLQVWMEGKLALELWVFLTRALQSIKQGWLFQHYVTVHEVQYKQRPTQR